MVQHNEVCAVQLVQGRPLEHLPSVSVIIPTYNRAHAVHEAIESALGQTLVPSEVIVVDDGSEDGTRERLAPYMNRIQYIYQENQGVSAARNTGVRAAKGDLIAFLDSDDVWHQRKLELQLQYLQEYPKIALVGAVSFVDPTRNWPLLPDSAHLSAHAVALEDVVLRSPFATSTVVVRKHCFDEVGYFDTGLCNAEDRDIYIRIASRYPMVKLHATLVWGDKEGEHLSAASAQSEQSTRKMLLGAFERLDSLRGRIVLRRRALSYAAFEGSYIYLAQGDRLRALRRVLWSLVLWPFPYSVGEAGPFRRVKRLIRILVSVCTNRFGRSSA
jgi:glycosyltransferase involved in cell wall biosynthesis